MRRLFGFFCLVAAFSSPAFAFDGTPLVSGNGFGYAVVQRSGILTKFYAHPYRFQSPNLTDATAEGVGTANFIDHAVWTVGGHTDSYSTQYLSESHLISSAGKDLIAEFFLPFGFQQNVLITLATAKKSTCLDVHWNQSVESRSVVSVAGKKVGVYRFVGVKESLAVIPLAANRIPNNGSTLFCGSGWALLSIEDPNNTNSILTNFEKWRAGRSALSLANRELIDHENWRVSPKVHFATDGERLLWRQSETLLRMAQIREPVTASRRSFGLIDASLPNGIWFIPWVRDMAYSTIALAKIGHETEARLALNAYMNAGPIGRLQNEVRGFPYQISTVRYFGDGSEESDYSGQQGHNLEFDNWGLALWAISEYMAQYPNTGLLNTAARGGSFYETARDYIVRPLLGNLDAYGGGFIVTKDTSIWEQNFFPRMHYAFSTIAAINGLRRFLPIASAMNDSATVAKINNILPLLEKGLSAAYLDGAALRGTLEPSPTNAVDGAVLEAFNMNVITDTNVLNSTLQRMSLLLAASGGYRRVNGNSNYEKQEFVYTDFNLARLYLRLGQPDAADAIFQRLVAKATQDSGLIPEMYVSEINDEYPGAIGDPTGAIPMVGYGAGMFLIYMAEREAAP